jgi:Fasciclin domain
LPVACLVAASLAGCAAGDSTTSATLPPMIVPGGQPVHGVSLQESALPVPGSTLLVVNSGLTGLDQYPTMLWLLTVSGVLDEIGARPVTVLAPTETAFRDFAVVDRSGLMANPATMAPILRRHVVLGLYTADELVAAGTVTTLAGERLSVWVNGRQVMVNEVTLMLPATSGTGDATMAVFGTDRLLPLPEGSG